MRAHTAKPSNRARDGEPSGDVIHAFNEEGFGSLDPDFGAGAQKTTPEQRERILTARLAGMGVSLSEEALLLIGAALPPAHALVEVEP
jgi:hypothetical protein